MHSLAVMRPDPRREPDFPAEGPIIERPWGDLPQTGEPGTPDRPADAEGRSSTSSSGTYPTAREDGPRSAAPAARAWATGEGRLSSTHRPWLVGAVIRPESAQLLIRPHVERRLDGIVVHVDLVNQTERSRPRTFTWTSGPFATGNEAHAELERLLIKRIEAAPSAWIEVNERCYPTVDAAMAAFWPAAPSSR